MRQLAALRSFARHLEREGHGTASAFAAIRTPKVDKNLPRPLSPPPRSRSPTPRRAPGEAREPWILARDAAVLSLLYGAGLRISEALGLQRRDAPVVGIDVLTVTGKGGKLRSVPVIRADPEGGRGISAPLPLHRRSGGPAVRRRARRPAFGAAHPARGRGTARRARASRQRHAARAAPFLRDPSPRPRRRPARHPGAFGPRLPLDDPALHQGRRGTAHRGFRRRASAGKGPPSFRGDAERRTRDP